MREHDYPEVAVSSPVRSATFTPVFKGFDDQVDHWWTKSDKDKPRETHDCSQPAPPGTYYRQNHHQVKVHEIW